MASTPAKSPVPSPVAPSRDASIRFIIPNTREVPRPFPGRSVQGRFHQVHHPEHPERPHQAPPGPAVLLQTFLGANLQSGQQHGQCQTNDPGEECRIKVDSHALFLFAKLMVLQDNGKYTPYPALSSQPNSHHHHPRAPSKIPGGLVRLSHSRRHHITVWQERICHLSGREGGRAVYVYWEIITIFRSINQLLCLHSRVSLEDSLGTAASIYAPRRLQLARAAPGSMGRPAPL